MRQSRQSMSHSPLPESQNRRQTKNDVAKSAHKKNVSPPPMNEELSHAIEQAKHILHNQNASAQSLPPLSLPLDELSRGDIPQPVWIIPEFLPVGVTVLAGALGVGKSVLALGLALAVAEGSLFLHWFSVEQGDVLYLGLEDSRKTFYKRASRFLQGVTLHVDNQSRDRHERLALRSCEWAGKWHMLHTCGLADLEDWLEAHPKARLIVIDSLSMVRPVSEKRKFLLKNDPILLPLQYIAQAHHVAILLLHHLNKHDTSSSIDIRNNSSQAMIDTVLLLRREKGLPTARLTINGRDICEQELLVTLEPQRGYTLLEKPDVVYGKK